MSNLKLIQQCLMSAFVEDVDNNFNYLNEQFSKRQVTEQTQTEVDNSKIKDCNVTTNKINNHNITTNHIHDSDDIKSHKITNEAITHDKLSEQVIDKQNFSLYNDLRAVYITNNLEQEFLKNSIILYYQE